jgi:hypothetical protein
LDFNFCEKQTNPTPTPLFFIFFIPPSFFIYFYPYPPEEDLDTGTRSVTKKFWSYIKSLGKDQLGVQPLKQDGLLHADSKTKASILNSQFQSVFTKEDMSNFPSKGPSPHSSMEDINITEPGVLKLLQSIKQHKAAGPDEIPARVLKELAPDIAPILTKIFRFSLAAGCVPGAWSQADVVPIYKKGSKNTASNYRPVSLTSICSKLMEHVLVSNIASLFFIFQFIYGIIYT